VSAASSKMLAIGRCLMGARTGDVFDEPSPVFAGGVATTVLTCVHLEPAGTDLLLVDITSAVSLKRASQAYVWRPAAQHFRAPAEALLGGDRVRRALSRLFARAARFVGAQGRALALARSTGIGEAARNA